MVHLGPTTPRTEVGNATYLRDFSQEASFEAPKLSSGDLLKQLRNNKPAATPQLRSVFGDRTNKPRAPLGEFTPMLKSAVRPNPLRHNPSSRKQPVHRSPGKRRFDHSAIYESPHLPTGSSKIYEDATGSSRGIDAKDLDNQARFRRSLNASTPLQRIADESMVHVGEEQKLTLKDQESVGLSFDVPLRLTDGHSRR